MLLRDTFRPLLQLTPVHNGGRWGDTPFSIATHSCTWPQAARHIRHAKVFLGDCSALHVLAVALGTPVVLVEPMEARWNPIFYPLGMDGAVQVVKGNDGRPTWDARHVGDVLRERLGASRDAAARARREEKRADDEYFRSGTRYPGQ